MKDGDFPVCYVSLSEGNPHFIPSKWGYSDISGKSKWFYGSILSIHHHKHPIYNPLKTGHIFPGDAREKPGPVQRHSCTAGGPRNPLVMSK
jgi:hypothetical protein